MTNAVGYLWQNCVTDEHDLVAYPLLRVEQDRAVREWRAVPAGLGKLPWRRVRAGPAPFILGPTGREIAGLEPDQRAIEVQTCFVVARNGKRPCKSVQEGRTLVL
jgi:hypothetical protein